MSSLKIEDLRAPGLEWIRPGPVTLMILDEVMARYERLCTMFDNSRVDIRSYVVDKEKVAFEVTISVSTKEQDLVVE